MKIMPFNKPDARGFAIALGHFDAIHNGHLSLINKCRESGAECGVFLFDKNPLEVLGRPAKTLNTYEERLLRLELSGADAVLTAEASPKFLALTGEEFADMLADIEPEKIVVGADYTCGRNGAADAEMLKNMLKGRGINTEIMPLLTENGTKIATSSIYELIAAGDIKTANSLMPIPYTVMGKVVGGRRVGRTFGIPTANIEITPEKLLPSDGVYSCFALIKGKLYKAVTNIGGKPTFDCRERTVESFILDFDGDLYGEKIALFLIERLRGTKKFDSVDSLKKQILFDVERTRLSAKAKIIPIFDKLSAMGENYD